LDQIEAYLDAQGKPFPKEIQQRIQIGSELFHSKKETVENARSLLHRLKNDFGVAFSKCHALLSPTVPILPPEIGDSEENTDTDSFTRPANLAGIPALTLPCGFSPDWLPIGLQIMAPPFAEDLLLQIAYAYEQSCDWCILRPNL